MRYNNYTPDTRPVGVRHTLTIDWANPIYPKLRGDQWGCVVLVFGHPTTVAWN